MGVSSSLLLPRPLVFFISPPILQPKNFFSGITIVTPLLSTPFPPIDQISVACFDATPFVAFFLFSSKYITVPLSVPVTHSKEEKSFLSYVVIWSEEEKDRSVLHCTCF